MGAFLPLQGFAPPGSRTIMSEFRSPLELRLIYPWANDGRGEWEFISDLRYYSDLFQAELIVPAGFRYDGASVPRLPLAYALYGGRYWRAAGLHDLGCREGLHPRKRIDKLFLEAMRVENAEEIEGMIAFGAGEVEIDARRESLEGQAMTMFAGVRLGSLW